MSSSFPVSLQNMDPTRGTDGQPLNNPNHVTHHQLEDDTLEAIQAKLGIDNSAVITSIDYLLKSTSSVSPGHKHVASEITDLAPISSSTGVSDADKIIKTDFAGKIDGSFSRTPTVKKYGVAIGSSTTQFDITNPTGTTFRYTWDGTGTDPVINTTTAPIGYKVNIRGTNMASANQGSFTITGSGTNYFEVTNASGVATNNQTIGNGHIQLYNPAWTKPANLVAILTKGVAAGGGGGGTTLNGEKSAGGGGGGYFEKLILAASLGSTETLDIGLGGAGGAATGGAGSAGGTTSFGSHCSATGGSGGTQNAAGGAGGIGTGGDINATGNGGGAGSTSATISAGTGGGSYFGGGAAAISGDGDGNNGSLYGGGGSGAVSSGSDRAGGSGYGGFIVVYEYYQ